MFRNADLKQRLPAFREMQASVHEIARAGGFVDVSPDVLAYAHAAEPAWVDSTGAVALPRGYRPETGPAVLMLQPGEEDRDFALHGTRRMAETAQRLAALSGTTVRATPDVLDGPLGTDGAPGRVNCKVLDILPSGSAESYPLFVPRAIVVQPQRQANLLGPIMMHEADHWDFYLNHLPELQRAEEGAITRPEIYALVERRGYRTTYDIERALGHYAGLGSLEQLSESYADVAPADAPRLVDDLKRRRVAAGHENTYFTVALATVVVGRLFGRPDELITAAEVTAMEALDIL